MAFGDWQQPPCHHVAAVAVDAQGDVALWSFEQPRRLIAEDELLRMKLFSQLCLLNDLSLYELTGYIWTGAQIEPVAQPNFFGNGFVVHALVQRNGAGCICLLLLLASDLCLQVTPFGSTPT